MVKGGQNLCTEAKPMIVSKLKVWWRKLSPLVSVCTSNLK